MARISRSHAVGMAAVVLVVALVGGGCTSSTKTTTPTPSALRSLTVAMPQDPGILAFAANGIGTYTFTRLLYDGLFRIVPTTRSLATVQPDAAQSWTVTDGGRVWTFHLRPGIKFSNGQPLTAQDVKFSIETIKNPKYNESAFLSEVSKVTTPDASTVVLTLTRPDTSIWPTLAEVIDIYPEAAVKQVGEPAFQKNPVGSGPYKLVKWTVNQSVTYVRNPSYWGPKPPFDHIEIKIVPDTSTAVDQLLAGSLDAAPVTTAQLPQIQGDSKLHLVSSSPASTVFFIGLRTDSAPTDNVLVRQALNYAIDRKALANTFVKNEATVPASVLPSFLPGATQQSPYPYDVAKAKSLLAQYGKPVSFKFDFPSNEQNTPLAQALANYWQAVGAHVTLVPIDPGAFFQKAVGGASGGGKLDPVFLNTWSGATDPGEILANTVASTGFLSYTNLPDLDQAIADGTSTIDQTARNADFTKADDICYQQACWVYLWYPNPLFGEVKGLTALSQTEGVWSLATAQVGT